MGAGFVGIVTFDIHLPEAGSLKGKRRDLRSLKADLQHRFGAAVAEVDHHDLWQRSTLAVAATSSSATGAAECADRIERFVEARHPEGVRFERAITAFQELL